MKESMGELKTAGEQENTEEPCKGNMEFNEDELGTAPITMTKKDDSKLFKLSVYDVIDKTKHAKEVNGELIIKELVTKGCRVKVRLEGKEEVKQQEGKALEPSTRTSTSKVVQA